MRDLRSAIGKTPAPTPDTGSSYPSSRFTSLGEAETSTGRAPLQHDGIPPRSQIHDGANWKKSQEHRLSQLRDASGSIGIPSDFSTPECRQTDGGYNSYQGQPVTAQGFGVGMTASQQWQGGPTFGGMMDG